VTGQPRCLPKTCEFPAIPLRPSAAPSVVCVHARCGSTAAPFRHGGVHQRFGAGLHGAHADANTLMMSFRRIYRRRESMRVDCSPRNLCTPISSDACRLAPVCSCRRCASHRL
jgi:hypothetical protein